MKKEKSSKSPWLWLPVFAISYFIYPITGIILSVIISSLLFFIFDKLLKKFSARRRSVIFIKIIYGLIIVAAIISGSSFKSFENSLKEKYGVLEYYQNKEEILEKEFSLLSSGLSGEKYGMLESINFEKIIAEESVNRSIACEKRNKNYYENTCYGFGIFFPSDWEIESGDLPHNLVKAKNQSGSILLVNVVKYVGAEAEKLRKVNVGLDDFFGSPKGLLELLVESGDLAGVNKITFQNIERITLKESKEQAYFLKYEDNNLEPKSKILSYTLYKNGILYTIVGGYGSEGDLSAIQESVQSLFLYDKENLNF